LVITQKGNIRPKSYFPTDVDYQWTFGDGSRQLLSSTAHAYADPGWKTVSLKMIQRIGSPPKANLVTKTNYILVENSRPL